MSSINKKDAREKFDKYVRQFDIDDEKVRLKIEHTYKVSELCYEIARNQGISEQQCDLAWLIGLLHDIGRFEQLRRYGTFSDAKSVNHAELGVTILNTDNYIANFTSNEHYQRVIITAIKYHNLYELPAFEDEECEMYSKIIRDADKIDIFRVICETPFEDIYDISESELKKSGVSESVMRQFRQQKTIDRRYKMQSADYIVGHIALVFGIYFPYSRSIADKQKFLWKIASFKSENESTKDIFEEVNRILKKYMQ